MRNDATAVALDILIWVSTPATVVAWLQISFPLWRSLPPFILILLSLGLILVLSQVLKTIMPTDSPAWVMVYRLFLCGCGLSLALLRVIL